MTDPKYWENHWINWSLELDLVISKSTPLSSGKADNQLNNEFISTPCPSHLTINNEMFIWSPNIHSKHLLSQDIQESLEAMDQSPLK